MSPKTLRAFARQAFPGSDRLTCKKDGTFEVRQHYFYRHGRSPETLAELVRTRAARAGLVAEILEAEDRWAPWPRDSYFRVHFTLTQANSQETQAV